MWQSGERRTVHKTVPWRRVRLWKRGSGQNPQSVSGSAQLQSLQSQLDFQEQSMVEKSLVSRQEAKVRELETKLEFEKTQVKRLEVSRGGHYAAGPRNDRELCSWCGLWPLWPEEAGAEGTKRRGKERPYSTKIFCLKDTALEATKQASCSGDPVIKKPAW